MNKSCKFSLNTQTVPPTAVNSNITKNTDSAITPAGIWCWSAIRPFITLCTCRTLTVAIVKKYNFLLLIVVWFIITCIHVVLSHRIRAVPNNVLFGISWRLILPGILLMKFSEPFLITPNLENFQEHHAHIARFSLPPIPLSGVFYYNQRETVVYITAQALISHLFLTTLFLMP